MIDRYATMMLQKKTIDNLELPVFVQVLLSYGKKRPDKGKFNETHFVAYVLKLVNNLRQNGVKGEKICEIDASANWYAKN